jgi:CRISPR-associated protein Csm5
MSFLESCRLGLEIVSPVHIGNQESYLAYEYLPDPANKKIHLLEITKVLELLSEKERQELLSAIEHGPNRAQQVLRRIASFNKDLLSAVVRTIAASDAFLREINDVENARQLELRAFIRGLDGPYIPGSSLKGALRTAWLHKSLNVNRHELLGQYGVIRQNQVEVKKEFWEKSLRKKPPRPLPEVPPSAAQQAEAQLLHAIDERGAMEATLDPFQALRVSDSPPITTRIERLAILHLKGKRMGGIPLLYEVADKGLRFSVSVRLHKGLGQHRENCRFTLEDVLEAAAEYFWNEAERELEEANKAGWSKAESFYEALLDRVSEGGSDEGSFLIRFGYGSGAGSKMFIGNLVHPEGRSIRILTRKTAGAKEPKDGYPMGWAIARLEPY